jgi:hypothetical protein
VKHAGVDVVRGTLTKKKATHPPSSEGWRPLDNLKKASEELRETPYRMRPKL